MDKKLNRSELKSLGRKITELLLLSPDKIGFYRTSLGMKTESGLAEAILNEVRKALEA